jgi:hypothetical protein
MSLRSPVSSAHRYASIVTTTAALCVPFVAPAQTILPAPMRPPPPAPEALSPKGTINADALNVLSLSWRQGMTTAIPQPAPAQYFHVCLYAPSIAQTCAAPAAGWFLAASAPQLNRTAVPNNALAAAFRLDVPMNVPPLDRELRWQVSSCSSQLQSSCSNASSKPLRLSRLNLLVADIDEQLTSSRLSVTVIVGNSGSINPGRVVTVVAVMRALYDPQQGCVTRLAEADRVPFADYYTFTADGRSYDHSENDAPVGVGVVPFPSLDYGEATLEVSVPPGTMVRAASVEVQPTNPPTPAAYVVWARVRERDGEFDVTDNTVARCHVVYE